MLSRLSLVIPTWRSNEMTQEEKFSKKTQLDNPEISKICTRSGHVSFGKKQVCHRFDERIRK